MSIANPSTNQPQKLRTRATPATPAAPSRPAPQTSDELEFARASFKSNRPDQVAELPGAPHPLARKQSFLQRVKGILLMGLGQDDEDDDYECTRG